MSLLDLCSTGGEILVMELLGETGEKPNIILASVRPTQGIPPEVLRMKGYNILGTHP